MGKVTITAFKFDTPDGAGQMLELVQQLACEAQSSRGGELITLEDAAMVTWSPGDKKPRTRHLGDMTGAGALGAAFWGMLFGLIFIVPCLGMAFGASLGALAGKFSTYGIDRHFVRSVSEKVKEGTSALFLMTSSSVVDRVAEAARQKGWAFEIISTNLSTEQETQLQQDFGAA